MSAKYTPGDSVRDPRCDAISGRLVSLQGDMATVRWDGKIVDSEIYIGDLRLETADETTKREHVEAWKEWVVKQPKARHVGTRWNQTAVYVNDLTDPDKMRQAAAELIQFADWFAGKPVKP